MLKGMPRPCADLDTEPFWKGCAAKRLLVPRCAACATPRWPPGPMCPACQSIDTEWIEARGRGRLYSWTVAIHPVMPILVDQVPYVIALVDLEEGVRVLSGLVDCPLDAIAADMPLVLSFQEQDGFHLPYFRPVPDSPEPAHRSQP